MKLGVRAPACVRGWKILEMMRHRLAGASNIVGKSGRQGQDWMFYINDDAKRPKAFHACVQHARGEASHPEAAEVSA